MHLLSGRADSATRRRVLYVHMDVIHSQARLQTGVVPYRHVDGNLEVLLITSRGAGHWLVPKGNIEPNLTPRDSAAREAWEEAGVFGMVHQQVIGTYRYIKRGTPRVVRLYPMAVLEELERWPEMHERRRQWLPIDQAGDLAFHDDLQSAIERLDAVLTPVVVAA